jgi:hypothetical protein
MARRESRRRLAGPLVFALALSALLSAAPGCTYARSRTADLLDSVPISFGRGWGIGMSLRATPFLHLGLGATAIVSNRVGYEDRLINGTWGEYQANFPVSLWAHDLRDLPELSPEVSWFDRGGLATVYRWQSMRDAPLGEGERGHLYEPNKQSWGRHPPIVREIRGAFLIPERRVLLEYEDQRRELGDDDPLVSLGSADRATLWVTERESRPTGQAWDLFEGDIMLLFVGVRVGLRPVEFLDFLLGFSTLDILGDDLPEPVVWEPLLIETAP